MMSDEQKEALSNWGSKFIERVGFPVAVCCVVLWFGFVQMRTQDARTEKMTEYALTTTKTLIEGVTAALNNSSVAVQAVQQIIKDDVASREKAIAVIERLDDHIDRWERVRTP